MAVAVINPKRNSATPVLIVTWWPPGVIGFRHYRDRVCAIARQSPIVVVSNSEQAVEFLEVPRDVVRFVPLTHMSLLGFWKYLITSFRIARSIRPERVLLLHSQLAPLTFMLRQSCSFVYWNEHPTHFYPEKVSGRAGLAKTIKNSMMRTLTYGGARRATLVMPIGVHHERDLLSHGCPPDRIRTMDMGVTDDFSNVAKRNDAGDKRSLSLIYVGSVQRERGRDVMIEAVGLANRKSPCATLTIVGADEAEQRACRQVAGKTGAGSAVHLIGRVNIGQIPQLLRNADVGLCFWADRTYWRFNPPTKLFEYLVAGLPVIASDIRTHTAYIRDGVNGRICSYDAASLAEVILELARDRAQFERLRAGARHSGEQYRWSRIEPRFLQAIGLA